MSCLERCIWQRDIVYLEMDNVYLEKDNTYRDKPIFRGDKSTDHLFNVDRHGPLTQLKPQELYMCRKVIKNRF